MFNDIDRSLHFSDIPCDDEDVLQVFRMFDSVVTFDDGPTDNLIALVNSAGDPDNRLTALAHLGELLGFRVTDVRRVDTGVQFDYRPDKHACQRSFVVPVKKLLSARKFERFMPPCHQAVKWEILCDFWSEVAQAILDLAKGHDVRRWS